MPEQLKNLTNLVPEKLRHLPPAKLFTFLGLLGTALAVGLVALLWMSDHTEQRVLYSRLTVEDAGLITAKLRDMKIPYTLQGDGTTILVPATVVYDTRLRLATEGLPQGGGVGFELFDRTNFGMTEFTQKLNYQRALQGELSRTITQLAAVHSARVHIVMPEKALFREQQEKTTASVVLTLLPGRALSQEQINGITQLVASSVAGLAAQDVMIVDQTGRTLSQKDGQTAMAQNEARLTYQRTIEDRLEHNVQSLLEQAVGKGKVQVRVSADLDFQRIERTEKRFDADNPAVRSEQRTREEGSGPGFWAIGVPGVRSNVTENPPNQQQTNTNTPTTSSRQSEVINYEVSEIVSKTIVPSGEVRKLSVAVLVDGTYQPGAKAGEAPKYTARTPEELATYREIVKGAVGFNETRGDRVEVASAPFEVRDDPDTGAFQAEATRLFWLHVGRYAAYFLLAVLCFLGVVRPLLRWITTREENAEPFVPRTVEELEASLEGREALPVGVGAAQLPAAAMADQAEPVDLRAQVLALVKAEPERAAEIIRFWLKKG